MKALIIDDNESLRMLLAVFLEGLGFEIDQAENGGIAFSLIKKNDYDLIVSDIDMPVVNGIELFYLISKQAPRLIRRIVFTTGSSLDGNHRDFLMNVPCPVLLKPFSLHQLSDVVTGVVQANCAKHTIMQPHQACA
jgi:CheY-like chemotaxis protein